MEHSLKILNEGRKKTSDLIKENLQIIWLVQWLSTCKGTSCQADLTLTPGLPGKKRAGSHKLLSGLHMHPVVHTHTHTEMS